jgi:hypothetical protein
MLEKKKKETKNPSLHHKWVSGAVIAKTGMEF